jgi:hypothetical protein
MHQSSLTKYSAVRPEGSLTPPAKTVVEPPCTCGVCDRELDAVDEPPPLRTVVPLSHPPTFGRAAIELLQMRVLALGERQKRSMQELYCLSRKSSLSKLRHYVYASTVSSINSMCSLLMNVILLTHKP